MAKFIGWLIGVLVLLAPAGAESQQLDPAGRWALRAGESTLMILELRRSAEGAGRWDGRLMRPRGLQIGAGTTPTLTVADPAVVAYKVEGRTSGAVLALRIQDSQGDWSQWRLAPAADHVLLGLDDAAAGATLQPLRLTKAWGEEQLSALEAGRRYALAADLPSNSEMAAIFAADQADRQAGAQIDWAAVVPRDEARRARTLELLNAGKLQSGDDFWHAAFVFQHGGEASSYLLAHTLAMIATARGRPDATWIAAATLDRYLQAIGQKQVYGTQFSNRDGAGWNQEPYDRALVSDALRAALGVPPQAEQAERVKELEAERRAQGAPPRR